MYKIINGVSERSPLLDIEYFDVTTQLPPDLMHVVLEGAVPHVLREVVNGLITDGVLGISDLYKVATIDYGQPEKYQKPESLTKKFVYGQTAYK